LIARLTMTVHSLELACRSHVGRVREQNEDCMVAMAERGLAAVADGMGGHRAGEVASRLAIDTLVRELLPAQLEDRGDDLESLLRIGQAVESANAAIQDEVRHQPDFSGMGTTLVVAIFRQGRVFFAHVGDSRLYRLRDGALECLTRDHSLIQQVLDQGEFANRAEARRAGIRDSILTRSLGINPEVEVDVGDAHLRAGDLFLLCSDGLNGQLSDAVIRKILVAGERDLDAAADQLQNAALASGGRDNITLILARPS
jgi:protein phosphatase